MSWVATHPGHDDLLFNCISAILSSFSRVEQCILDGVNAATAGPEAIAGAWVTKMSESIQSHLNTVMDSVSASIVEKVGAKYTSDLCSRQDHLRDLVTNSVLPTLSTVTRSLQKVEKHQDDHSVFMANSSNKGKVSETELVALLSDMLESAEILHASTALGGHTGDVHIKRVGKPLILVENKEYARNVPEAEVTKFIRDVRQTQCHGIFISQTSGIVNRKEWEFMVIDKKYICIFLTHVKAMPQKILSAVHFIDHFDELLATCSVISDADKDGDAAAAVAGDLESSATIVRLSADDVRLIEGCFKQWYQLREKLLKDLKNFAAQQKSMLSGFTFGGFEELIRDRLQSAGILLSPGAIAAAAADTTSSTSPESPSSSSSTNWGAAMDAGHRKTHMDLSLLAGFKNKRTKHQ
jgi:hypothetical protein